MIENRKIESAIDEIHSFDAYYKNVILNNSNLIIPYINLGVSNHEINPSSNLLFIDFAYMVFERVSFLSVYINNRRLVVVDKQKTKNLYHFGGSYLDFDRGIFNDLEICAKQTYLQTLSLSKLSETMWIPLNVPNLSVNMDLEIVKEFYNNIFAPDNIKKLAS